MLGQFLARVTDGDLTFLHKITPSRAGELFLNGLKDARRLLRKRRGRKNDREGKRQQNSHGAWTVGASAQEVHPPTAEPLGMGVTKDRLIYQIKEGEPT